LPFENRFHESLSSDLSLLPIYLGAAGKGLQTLLVKGAPSGYQRTMKRLVFLAALAGLICGASNAQEAASSAPVRIPASEAKANIGTNAVVTGRIAEVNKAATIVHLNFDHPFPKQTFTAVIFSDKTNLFPEIEKLKDKTVEVSGKITEYRERPEIVLTNTNQLRIIEKPAESEKK